MCLTVLRRKIKRGEKSPRFAASVTLHNISVKAAYAADTPPFLPVFISLQLSVFYLSLWRTILHIAPFPWLHQHLASFPSLVHLGHTSNLPQKELAVSFKYFQRKHEGDKVHIENTKYIISENKYMIQNMPFQIQIHHPITKYTTSNTKSFVKI